MTSPVTALRGYLGYKGREGQLSFLLHRFTGLGTVLFLTIHILDTATVYFFPDLYEHAIELYRNPFFGVGEIFLVFSVLYHGLNGLRIAFFDWFPKYWNIATQRRWAIGTLVVAIILWLPMAFWMARTFILAAAGE